MCIYDFTAKKKCQIYSWIIKCAKLLLSALSLELSLSHTITFIIYSHLSVKREQCDQSSNLLAFQKVIHLFLPLASKMLPVVGFPQQKNRLASVGNEVEQTLNSTWLMPLIHPLLSLLYPVGITKLNSPSTTQSIM